MSKARKFADASRISDALTLPAGDTASRPAGSVAGSQRYNTDTGSIEFYDGTNWISTNLIPTIDSITGTIYAGFASTLTFDLSNTTETITVRFTEGGVVVAEVGDVAVTDGAASVEVPAAVYGQTVGDTIAVLILNLDGTPSNEISKTVIDVPSGGTITTVGDYRYHTFTSSSSLVVPSGFSASADFLIVAGGGSGGNGAGGGGGAGGYIDSTVSLSAGTYSATVGAGAPATTTTNGSNSVFNSLTAIGGGGGGGSSGAQSGGSGGGASYQVPSGTGGGAGTVGQGNAGGTAFGAVTDYVSGGGGGAGAVGQNAPNTNQSGAGGAGLNWKSLGTFYAGGGGGSGTTQGAFGGAGGNGGGGAGAPAGGGSGTNGTVNRGGGGGGEHSGVAVGAGGSGIVIVRYAL